MPNYKEHKDTGGQLAALITTIGSLAEQNKKVSQGLQPNMDLSKVAGEALVALIGGRIGGVLPDAIEPATCPNHRGFFHSVASTILVAQLTKQVKENPTIHPTVKTFVNSIAIGYYSHLGLDCKTPSGLPLI